MMLCAKDFSTKSKVILKVQFMNATIDQGLIPGLSVDIKLTRNNREFVILCADKNVDADIKIREAKIYVRVSTVKTSVYDTLERRLATKDAIYHLRRTKVTSKNIPINSTSFCCNDILQQDNPCKIAFAFVPNSWTSGGLIDQPN